VQSFQLWDITDVPAFITAYIQRTNPELTWHEREDLHQELTIATWQASLTFDPARSRFSTFATSIISRKTTDWKRKTKGRTKWQFAGRTHERKLPTLIPYDTDQLEHHHHHHPSPPDRDTDLMRALTPPSRNQPRHPRRRRDTTA
jgi:DNA-directed RNA polymerase specialized sigma24 family protein